MGLWISWLYKILYWREINAQEFRFRLNFSYLFLGWGSGYFGYIKYFIGI